MKTITAIPVLFIAVLMGPWPSGRAQSVRGLPAPATNKLAPPVEVSIELEEGRLANKQVFGWFRPSVKDMQSIRETILADIAKGERKITRKREGALNIWIVVRKYYLQTTNNSGRALVSVAWCAASDVDHIVFHEEFYASKYTFSWLPKGAIKNAIAGRIAQNYLGLVSMGEGDAFLQPEAVPNTFLSLKEAIDNVGRAVLPDTGQNVGSDGYYTYYSMYDWDWSQHPDRINWKEYISNH